MFIIKLLSQHVSGIIMPIIREQECALQHMVLCTVTRGEQNRGVMSTKHSRYRLCLVLIIPHKDTTALTSYGFVPLLLQCRTPYAAVHTIIILMMGIMMPETC